MPLLVGAASNSGGGGYKLEKSLRFRASASAYLNRTPGSAGNRRTWTWSGWVKRGELGTNQVIFDATSGSTPVYNFIYFEADKIKFGLHDLFLQLTTSVFRDPSAWYHIVVVYDSTQVTSTDRAKIYVNGDLQTVTGTYPGLNVEGNINSNVQHNVGRYIYGNNLFLDGYLSELNLVDGQALSPTDFGETDNNGTWIPKKYTGTYGTNGFYLDFEDTSSVAALGTDSSGNSNTWTVNNISLTAGTTYDSMTDVPTLTDEDTANFATLNPLDNNGVALTEGNLTGVIALNENVSATIAPTSGKWYWEVYVVDYTNPYIGIKKTESNTTGFTGEAVGINNQGDIYFNASNQSKDGLPSFSNTNIVGVALNVDAQKIWWSKNGQWYTADAAGESAIASSEVAAGNNGYDYSSQITNAKPYVGSSASNGSVTLNFGQRPFSYTPPTGFKKLNTFNLPDSTIEDGSDYFKPVLYTGNGSSQSIIGVGFQPDWTWIKGRSAATAHGLYDAVRGVQKDLVSDSTAAETTQTTGLTAFNSNGFTTGVLAKLNTNSATYVAWNWKAASTAASTYVVKVVSDSGNKYRFDDFGTSAVTLNLHETGTYTFDQSDSSNSGHPLRFSSTSDGTHGGGSEYTTGVTVTGVPGTAGAKTVIVVAASAPTLYYYCSVHSGMGGQANTNVTKGSSNFDGTIVSTVSANPTAGFSVVTYGGNSTAGATVGHGLGAVPDTVIIKNRTGSSGFQNWAVYHSSLLNTQAVFLNTSGAVTASTTYWNNTTPTASVFSLGHTGTDGWNITGQNFVAYCFANVEGYSKFGSYTGNGNANGAFVYTGFKPKMVIIKTTSAAFEWVILDTERNPENLVHDVLYPSLVNAEADATTYASFDAVSNGFKLRNTHQYTNYNGYNYIYMAFAENPFKNSTAR
mgnify:FL=1